MKAESNPWTRISATTVYENPWIRVEDHVVINPSGGRSQYGKICFKSRAVAVIAVDKDDNLHLVGQYRYTLDEYSWELPMGGAALDEPVEVAARRELREETGLTARRWREIMKLHTSNSVTDEVGYVYVAEDLTRGASLPEETEQLEQLKLPVEEARRWALDGRITDAMSVAGILHYCLTRDGVGRSDA